MPWGEIAGYSVAAKTGTAQEWNPAKHCLCNYGSSYIGIVPAKYDAETKMVEAKIAQKLREKKYTVIVTATPCSTVTA